MKTKLFSVAMCGMFALALTSCGTTGTTTTTDSTTAATNQASNTATTTTVSASAAQQSGATAGSSILSLYNNYKSAGKLDMSNTSNILSAMSLASSAIQIKDNYTNKDYYKNFGLGMLSSAAGLITNSNVDSTINTLANTDLSSLLSIAGALTGQGSTGAATVQSSSAVGADATAAILNNVNSSSSSSTSTSNNTATAISALTTLLGSLSAQ